MSGGRQLGGNPFAEQRLDDRVLVVTGGTQGLGAAIAARAARLGAAGIVICGRDATRGEVVRRELEELGCEAVFAAAELADERACRAVIATCDEHFGRLDGLVNAAGLSTRGTLDSTSVELWDHLFAVNVRAPFILMQEAALTAYAASKGALATLTRNVGHQLQPDRIRVNGLNIGWTATEGEHAVQTGTGEPEDWLASADSGAPLGRLLRPDDIAPMVTYLLSDAAALVTGSVIDFDQTVHGAAGEHVAPAPAGASA
jgi:NAD(P)-dependent dehydrogenase (short-subunit alcohol dehydrogenase family)